MKLTTSNTRTSDNGEKKNKTGLRIYIDSPGSAAKRGGRRSRESLFLLLEYQVRRGLSYQQVNDGTRVAT